MARSTIGADATVRKHVLALRCEHRMLLTDTLLGDSVDWGEYAYIELSKGITPLENGEDTLIHRYELPVHHPVALRGHAGDYVVLGADDVVREL